jgi:hypothetical protein
VLTLYRMPADLREEMGRAGRTYFEAHFERETLLDRMEAIIESVVVHTGPPRSSCSVR